MLNKIKELADEAIKLQNKNRMDEVLREISAMCTPKYNDNDIEPSVFCLEKKKEVTRGEMVPIIDEIGEHLMAIDAATRAQGTTVNINDVPKLVAKAWKAGKK